MVPGEPQFVEVAPLGELGTHEGKHLCYELPKHLNY
jgi:hypothetical protein